MTMLAKSTARDLADVVRKSAKHLAAEQQLDALRSEHDQLQERQRELIAGNRDRAAAEINAISEKMNEIERAMRPLRVEIAECREVHGAAVARALRNLRSDAARRIVELLADMRSARDIIDETQVLIERAGGSAPRMPPLALNDIEQAARRIAGIR